MTVRDGKVRWWAAGVGLSLLLIGLGVFQLRAGLADADRWASVFGVFLNVAGLAVAVYSAALARRAATSPSATDAGKVTNQIHGGQFAGPVLQGRDLHAAAASPAAAERPGTSSTPDAGAVSNQIEGSTIGGPVIQGRDIHGLLLPHPPDSTASRLEGKGERGE